MRSAYFVALVAVGACSRTPPAPAVTSPPPTPAPTEPVPVQLPPAPAPVPEPPLPVTPPSEPASDCARIFPGNPKNLEYLALEAGVFSFCHDDRGTQACWAFDLERKTLAPRDLPASTTAPGAKTMDVPGGLRVDFESGAISLCTTEFTDCKALDVTGDRYIRGDFDSDRKRVVVTTEGRPGAPFKATFYDVVTRRTVKTLTIGTDDYPCGDIEFLGPEVLLVRRQQCDAARGEALLLDPTTYATRAQVGQRGFRGYKVFAAQIEGNRWAFRDQDGLTLAIHDVTTGALLQTLDLAPTWPVDQTRGRPVPDGDDGALFGLGDGRLLVMHDGPAQGTLVLVDGKAGTMLSTLQIPACDRPAEPVAIVPEVPSAPRCIALAKAGGPDVGPFEHAELDGDAFFGCRREPPPTGSDEPVVACYRFDLGSGRLEAAAVPNDILHAPTYSPFPPDVAFEEASGAVVVKASGLKLDLDGQRATSAEVDAKAERLAVVAGADSKPAVAYIFDLPGGVRRAKFVAGTDDFTCAGVAFLGTRALLVSLSVCAGPGGRAYLADADTGERKAWVGGRDDWQAWDVKAQHAPGGGANDWAFREQYGSEVAVQDVITGKVLRRIDLSAHLPLDPESKLPATDPQWGWLFRTTGGKLAVLNEGAGAQGVFIIVDPVAGVVDRVVKMPGCN